jgi:hypothetical protein
MSKNQMQTGSSYLENVYKAQPKSPNHRYLEADSMFSIASSVKQDAWGYPVDDTVENEEKENK